MRRRRSRFARCCALPAGGGRLNDDGERPGGGSIARRARSPSPGLLPALSRPVVAIARPADPADPRPASRRGGDGGKTFLPITHERPVHPLSPGLPARGGDRKDRVFSRETGMTCVTRMSHLDPTSGCRCATDSPARVPVPRARPAEVPDAVFDALVIELQHRGRASAVDHASSPEPARRRQGRRRALRRCTHALPMLSLDNAFTGPTCATSNTGRSDWPRPASRWIRSPIRPSRSSATSPSAWRHEHGLLRQAATRWWRRHDWRGHHRQRAHDPARSRCASPAAGRRCWRCAARYSCCAATSAPERRRPRTRRQDNREPAQRRRRPSPALDPAVTAGGGCRSTPTVSAGVSDERAARRALGDRAARRLGAAGLPAACGGLRPTAVSVITRHRRISAWQRCLTSTGSSTGSIALTGSAGSASSRAPRRRARALITRRRTAHHGQRPSTCRIGRTGAIRQSRGSALRSSAASPSPMPRCTIIFDEVARRDVRIGDTVIVRRAGGVIPGSPACCSIAGRCSPPRSRARALAAAAALPVCGSHTKRPKARRSRAAAAA